MIKTKTIKVEIEITFEYDTDKMRFDESYCEAVAKDNTIRPYEGIEDGVRILKVCDQAHDTYWKV